MALSNIFREPRREIIETLVGVGVIILGACLVFYPDYRFGLWFNAHCVSDSSGPHDVLGIGLGMFFGLGAPILGFLVLTLIAVAIHAVGESLCDALDRRGLRLRPTQRW